MRHAPAFFLVAISIFLAFTLAQGDKPLLGASAVGSEQVTRGGELYRRKCAVCHGPTALGFDEARAAFPEEDRHCERCHKTNNPRIWNQKTTIHNNMFSLGTPPALRGESTLHAFKDADALFQYIRATMPRYAPGRLTNEEYLDITAFLLTLRGASPRDAVQDIMTEENAATFLLR